MVMLPWMKKPAKVSWETPGGKVNRAPRTTFPSMG